MAKSEPANLPNYSDRLAEAEREVVCLRRRLRTSERHAVGLHGQAAYSSIGRLLLDLIRRHGAVFVADHSSDDERQFYVSALANDFHESRCISRSSLLECLQIAMDHEESHTCRVCGRPCRPRRKRTGGYMPCKACERKRVKAYDSRRAAAKK